jgi:hypothetical protein
MENERSDRLRLHWQKHRLTYIVGAAGTGLGLTLGVLICKRPVYIVNTVAPVFNNDNSSSAEMLGYMRKIVRCNETGVLFDSVKSAAKNAGVSSAVMSKCLNGRTDHIKGLTYSIEGLATL